MAIFAANYGCRVTTTTISREQLSIEEEVEARGLGDRITLLFEDYRDLTGSFDKLVSIEMIEAVGHEYYDTYFDCQQTIEARRQSSDSSNYHQHATLRRISPISRLHQALYFPRWLSSFARRHWQCSDAQNRYANGWSSRYCPRLCEYGCWHKAFLAELDAVKSMGFDEKFIRMWRFYLSYCEGGFRERIIGTYQITMAKPYYRPT